MLNSFEFLLKVDRKDIDFINKIIESYEGIAIQRCYNNKEGLIKLFTTTYFVDEVEIILNRICDYGISIQLISKKIWEGVL